MTSIFEDALSSLALLEAETDGVELLAALPNQEYDTADALVDTIQITCRITGRPGTFSVSVPYDFHWQALAFVAIGQKARVIELIYEGAATMQDVPTVYLVPDESNVGNPFVPPGSVAPV